ncbi:type IV secretion protein DotH [Acetobacter orientalis]|uniref:Type IV secretion protein DotH n=1 Tax=Acetobacter orientalis TaxID=146474 RepID=A0A252C1Y4_9PROT|nr:type IV secretion protein DotH [Acetobacter orientalis]BBC81874.1 type IV secretion protein DotH [Acetobacter orientalis]
MHTNRLSLVLSLGMMLSVPSVACAQSHQNGIPDDREKDHVDPIYAGTLPPPPSVRQDLYDRYDTGQKTLDAEDDPHLLASPTSRSLSVSFEPGAQIPIVRLAQGYPAAITFLDATGQPWPIAWDLATNKAASCDADGKGSDKAPIRAVGINACVPQAGSNILQITPISRYPRGGLLVTLKDAPKPISFMIVAGTGAYDADLTVRITRKGPNAKEQASALGAVPDTSDPVLNNLLDGVPPMEAVPLLVSGVSADRLRAWKLKNTMYIRTTFELSSPAAIAHVSAFDVTAYAAPFSTRLLVSTGERLVPVSVQEDTP